MNTYTYKVHLEPEPEGGFTATVPALPGCVTWGRDYCHALQMAQEAIQGHLETLAELGKPLPKPDTVAIPVDTWVQVKAPAQV